ncbi:MAG TPA: DUF507 family protein [Polyangia bacterium]|jgi:hypothetical protein
MKLFSGKVPIIAQEIVRQLTTEGDVETAEPNEVELDVESVLKEYLRTDREITEKAKDLMDKRNLPYGQFGKIKRAMAEEKGFGLGEDGIGWICSQLIEILLQSGHVEEVFADDNTLRRKMRDILRKHMMVDDELDEEVRKRIKNLEEGTQTWDVEYNKVLEQIKRNRGLA